MPLASWLFVRGSESIWVERLHGYTMLVAGPGVQCEEREFNDESTLQQFQIALATRLVDAGWFLWGYNRDRRERLDRRSTSRQAVDRRQPRA
jgi:hypothetical protein